ncbi:MAG: OB-fold nucleic acid binding domain-containing protein [Candidatus Helarchaeota archaeon]
MNSDFSQRFKRETAFKLSISDIIRGKFIKTDNRSYIITPFGLNVNRARILGTVIDIQIYKQDQNQENIEITKKDYGYLVIDDGTETIRVKFWGDDIEKHKLQDLEVGDNVDIIGRVREYNDEIFIMPEMILKITDPNWELLRELEKIEIKELFKKKKLSNVVNVSEDVNEKITNIVDNVEKKPINYSNLKLIKVNQLTSSSKRVNLIAKCVEMEEIRQTSNNNQVMNTILGDETGCVVVPIWNEDIKKMKKGESYLIYNGYVSTFQDKLNLNVGKYGQLEISEEKISEVNKEFVIS